MPSVTTLISPTENPTDVGQTQYTPPNWATQKALYSILVSDVTTTQPVTEDPDNPGAFLMKTNVAGSTTTMFVFDGIRRADHDQSCIPTKKPLQTGYNSSDHAVLQPARIVIEAVMSDAIAAYSSGIGSDGKPNAPIWSGNPSKSVSAFQQMINLMKNRALITLNTRLQTYTNCLLVNVRSADNQRSYFGAELTLTFEQLIISTVSVQFDSARSQTTGDTSLGTVQTQNPDPTTLAQHTVGNGQPYISSTGETFYYPPTTIPGAGLISSNVVNQVVH